MDVEKKILCVSVSAFESCDNEKKNWKKFFTKRQPQQKKQNESFNQVEQKS